MTDFRQSQERLSLKLCIGWGMGGFGTILLGDSFGALLLRYMTDLLGIAAATAAMLVAGSKLYDGVMDPLLGAFSDRLRTRIGRRRPLLIAGIITSPLAILAMFITPSLSGSLLVVYAAGVLVLYSTSYALWEVPYVSMPAEMTQNYSERTRLFAYRNYAANAGQLSFVFAGPWLLAYLGASRSGYAGMAVALALLAMMGNLICVLATARAPFIQHTDRPPFRFADAYLRPLKHRPFLILVGAKSAMFIGISAQSGMFAYFVKYVLGVSDVWLGYLLLIMSASSLTSVPIWIQLGRRLEKKHVAALGVLLIVLASASWITATKQEPVAFLVLRTALKSAGLTGFMIFVYSMFTDAVEDKALSEGARQEGAMSGLFATAEKISAAIGLASVGFSLQIGGYVSSLATAAHQTSGAVRAIQLIYSLAPASFGIVCIALLLTYPLTSKTIALKRAARGVV